MHSHLTFRTSVRIRSLLHGCTTENPQLVNSLVEPGPRVLLPVTKIISSQLENTSVCLLSPSSPLGISIFALVLSHLDVPDVLTPSTLPKFGLDSQNCKSSLLLDRLPRRSVVSSVQITASIFDTFLTPVIPTDVEFSLASESPSTYRQTCPLLLSVNPIVLLVLL